MSLLRRGTMMFFLASALLSHIQPLFADSVNVTIGTAALSGTPGTLVFEFIDGDGAANNNITISNLQTDAATGFEQTFGSVTGDVVTPSDSANLSDASFFSELVVPATFGNSVTFSLDYTNNLAAGALAPDSFSVFLLDPAGLNSLVTTDLPGDELLEIDMVGGAAASVSLASAISPGVTISQGTNGSGSGSGSTVPEPSSLIMLALGLAAFAAQRLHNRSIHFGPIRRA